MIKGGQKQSNFLENYCNIPAVKGFWQRKKEDVKEYIRNVLSQSAPIEIPSFAKIKDQKKNGYNQVKYTWRADGYKYEVRWHTRTPGAPITEGNTWQVRRHKPGVGFGNNARPPVDEVLVKSATGKKWVPFEMWQASIDAKTANRLTKENEKVLRKVA